MLEHGLGALESPSDARDLPLSLDMATLLPGRMVSTLMPPVLNQAKTNTCVPHTAAGSKGWQERRDRGSFLPFDPFWLYPRAQEIDGIPLPHEGTTMRAALRVLKGTGMALIGHPETAYHFKIANYYAVSFTVDALKRSVQQYGPVLCAAKWYNSWMPSPPGGLLPKPVGYVGGHGTLLFGWDDNVGGGSFLFRNSWGKYWGVNGNFYVPYRYYLPNMHDAWKAIDILGD